VALFSGAAGMGTTTRYGGSVREEAPVIARPSWRLTEEGVTMNIKPGITVRLDDAHRDQIDRESTRKITPVLNRLDEWRRRSAMSTTLIR